MEYSSLLGDWTISGASLIERERLLVHPGVLGLAGFAFNKWALLTNDFEVVFHFRVTGEKDAAKVPHDQSFAFWYIYENMTASYNETAVIKDSSWTEGLRKQGMTLIGSKAKFEGFGAVFSSGASTAQAARKPTVSFVSNDGTEELDFSKAVPGSEKTQIDFRNTLNPAQMRIRVKPHIIEGFIKQSPSLAWQTCFRIHPKSLVKVGGYIGFTAWSGTDKGGDGLVADLVSLVQVDTANLDDTSTGEEVSDVAAPVQEVYKDLLSEQNRHFVDQRSQTEHLGKLLSMLAEHVNATRPAEEKLFQEIQGLGSRVNKLSEDCKNLLKETHFLLTPDSKASAHDLHKAGVEAMKSEIIGLRRLLVKDSATQRQKLDAVQKNIAEVKQRRSTQGGSEALLTIAKQTDILEKTVSSRGMQMTWMLICMMAAILGIGGLMWNRMHYYEKKHFI